MLSVLPNEVTGGRADAAGSNASGVGAHSGFKKVTPLKRSHPRKKLAAEVEDNVDSGVDFNWVAIEHVRLVAPVPDCIQGCLLQHGVAADNSQILDGSS